MSLQEISGEWDGSSDPSYRLDTIESTGDTIESTEALRQEIEDYKVEVHRQKLEIDKYKSQLKNVENDHLTPDEHVDSSGYVLEGDANTGHVHVGDANTEHVHVGDANTGHVHVGNESRKTLEDELKAAQDELKAAHEKITETQNQLHIEKEKNEELLQEVEWKQWTDNGIADAGPSADAGSGADNMSAQVEQLKSELEMSRNAQETLQTELDQMRSSCQCRGRDLKENGSTTEATQVELERVTATLRHTEQDLQTSRRELEKVREDVLKKDEVLKKVREDVLQKDEELEMTKQQLEKTKDTPRKNRIGDLTHKKLETALKAKKESELKCEELNRELNRVSESKCQELEASEKKCEELSVQVEKVEGEKSVLQERHRGSEEKWAERLEKEKANCQQETCRRMELEDQLSLEKKNYDYNMCELEASNSNYMRDLQEKQEREEELMQEIQSVMAVKARTETELKRALAEKEEVAKEKEEVVKENTQVLAQLKLINEDKEQLRTQVLAAEEVCGEFKEEVVLTMEGYNKIAKDLEDERAKCFEYKGKRDKVMNELSKRTEETLKQAKAIEKLKAELSSQNETLQVLQMQVEQYVGDFEIERKAREKAVGKLSELHKRVENLEKEKKDLRRQLNQQAANQCQVEFAELEDPN